MWGKLALYPELKNSADPEQRALYDKHGQEFNALMDTSLAAHATFRDP
jgi:hypothetical protein